MDHVTIERTGRIAVVRFDSGHAANALSMAVMRGLTEAARSFENDAEVSAVVLTGRAETFSMGYDLKDLEAARLRDAGLAERRLGLTTGPRMCRAWEEIQALTVCAVEGWCVGGGVALTVATDLRVASDAATFYVPEIERGMNMSWGSVPRITNLVGPARAKRLIVLAEKLPALQARDWGLVDEIADPESAFERAMEFARRAAELPPVGLRMCKQEINAYANALAAVSSHGDVDQFALAQTGADFEEGIRAFLEGRPPDYTGR